MSNKKKVLTGHKKIGSKFIPPVMQLSGITEISYIHQILPEIIWIGLIYDRFGYQRGIELVTEMAKMAFILKETDNHVNFSLASSYNLLSDNKKEELVALLAAKDYLANYQDSICPLVALYEECPLSFVGVSEGRPNNPALLETMKNCIKRHINKYETPSLTIQASVIYVRGLTGGLYLPSNSIVPDLNALFESPESEEAKYAAGFVRSSIMVEFMPKEEVASDAWARKFWNHGLKLDSCDFSWEGKNGTY